MKMNIEMPATEFVRQFMNKKVWRKLYGPSASDWLSIREASMEVDGTKDKGYTLNRSVQLCINRLKNTEYLETRKVVKIKKSMTKVGTPRKYTSTCPRHRLNVIKLWSDYVEENYRLSARERALLKSILRDPKVERVLRRRNLKPREALDLVFYPLTFAWKLETSKGEIEEFLDSVCHSVARNGVGVLDHLEPNEGNAYALMRRFLEFLIQNKMKFAALNSIRPNNRERFLKALVGKLFKDFLKQTCDEDIKDLAPPSSLKDETGEFLRAVMRNLRKHIALDSACGESLAWRSPRPARRVPAD
jgi:hypothetical protein